MSQMGQKLPESVSARRPLFSDCNQIALRSETTGCATNGLMRRSKLTSLFDQLVGADKQCRWHVDTERLGRLQVDHQFELGRLFDRQVRRLRTLENLVNEARGATI